MYVGRGCFLQREPLAFCRHAKAGLGQVCLREEAPSEGAFPRVAHLTAFPSPRHLVSSHAGRILRLGIPWDSPDLGVQTALCVRPSLSISLSWALRADSQVPTYTGGPSGTHPWLGVQGPHPHPKSKAGATSLHQDLNLAWWGLGEMVAWRVLLAFSSKFFWVVPGGFHSKWRIISSLEVLAAIPRQQKEFCLTSCSQAHSFIQAVSLNTGH